MRRWWKKFCFAAAALAAVLAMGTVLPVTAAQERADLTLCLKNKNHKVEFALYKAADIEDGQYRLIDPFTGTGVDLNHLEHASEVEACAKALYQCVKERDVPVSAGGYTSDGKLSLSLESGLYLVAQVTHDRDRLKVSPFLISAPIFDRETGEWEYDVTAYPKSEERKDEPETPEKPHETVPPAPKVPPGTPGNDVPDKGVLGAIRQGISDAVDQAAGVLGARVRTGDESPVQAAVYLILAAAAAGGIIYVCIRRKKEKK